MVLVMFLVMLQLVSPLGGGGWRVAMSGGAPEGEAMRCFLSVGLTQVSAMTHLESLLHARILSGCVVEMDLLWGDSRQIGGHAGSGLGATGKQGAYLYASDTRSLGRGTHGWVGLLVCPQ